MSRHRSKAGRGRTTLAMRRHAARLAFLMAAIWVLPAWGAPDVGALQSAVVWIRANPQSKPGAGVVIKVEGAKAYVLTAYHVVRAAWEAGSHEVAVRFHRQVGAPARGVMVKEWLLPREDLAVLVVEDAPGKSAVPVGSGALLQVRDPVIAIGHRDASDWVVTDGKVSALTGRDILFSGDAVDTGNSGGPLLDANGRMVGLIVAVQGTLGEAVALDVIRPIVERWVGALATPAAGAVAVPATPPAVAAPAPVPLPSAPAVKAPPPTRPPARAESAITVNDGAEMVLVPAGQFWMGRDSDDFEGPRHRVTLDGFSIDKYEVTNALYQRFMSATGRPEPKYWNPSSSFEKEKYRGFNGQRQPVVGVSWHDADAYCRWAGKRLPTEAEWEKAARGTDERQYPWGDQWDASRVSARELGHPVEVGSYPTGVSPYGAHDMAGSVSEWVADWHSKYYYRRSLERNPTGPDAGISRVVRGGSWGGNALGFHRSTFRLDYPPDLRNDFIGFRCARGLSP